MTENLSETLIRRDISAVGSQLKELQDSLRVVSNVGEGLRNVSGVVGDVMANLDVAVETQQKTEEARRVDALKNRQRFWVTIGGIVLANVIVIVISLFVLLGQIDARDLSEARSEANRGRQSCATSLLVEWDAKLGNALRVTTQIPIVPRESSEYREAIDELNEATTLIGKARDLCYGEMPVPDPVPH